jgi:hypothetical protein
VFKAESGSLELRPALERLTLKSDAFGREADDTCVLEPGKQLVQVDGPAGLMRADNSQAEQRAICSGDVSWKFGSGFCCIPTKTCSGDVSPLAARPFLDNIAGSTVFGILQFSHFTLPAGLVILQSSQVRHP